MKYVLAILATLFLASSTSAQSPPSETVCYTKTLEAFLEDAAKSIITVHVIKGAELEEFLKNVNIYRAGAGGQLWAADMLLIGELVDGNLGIVLFQDGCKVKDSDWMASRESMAKMFESNKSLGILKRLNLLSGDGV